MLASHYLAAYRASRAGPEADAVAAQARIAMLAAAERAIALHRTGRRIGYLEQALTVTHDAAQRAAIHERIVVSSEYAGCGRYARRPRPQGDGCVSRGGRRGRPAPRRHTDGPHLIGFHLEDEADRGAASPPSRRPSRWASVPELAGAYAELARAQMLAERPAEAIAAADQALRMGAIADAETVVEALVTKGTSMTISQRNVEAEAILRGAIPWRMTWA